MAAHPAPPLAVSEPEAEALRAMARAGTTEQRTAMRARIVLRAAEGAAHVEIAGELGVSVPTVLLWRRRFKEQGLAGLADAPHPGRPRTYGRDVREQILAATLTPPEATTHWSTRRLAKRVGVSPSTVARVWHEGRLRPHRTETFKYSRDPQLVAKVTDVVGLYLAPPERAIVLSVDEKTQIQALELGRDPLVGDPVGRGQDHAGPHRSALLARTGPHEGSQRLLFRLVDHQRWSGMVRHAQHRSCDVQKRLAVSGLRH